MIDEYKAAGVSPRHLFAQSFNQADVICWVRSEPAFGKQAVFLDDAETVAELPSYGELQNYKAQGINIVAPPLFELLRTDPTGQSLPRAPQQRRGCRARHHHLDARTLRHPADGATASTNRPWTALLSARATC